MSATSSFYDNNALQLAKQYNALDFESVHQSWSAYWPKSGDAVLDIGEGSGRDAQWMSEQGCEVIAVEPSDALRQLGQAGTTPQVTWLNDSLPALKSVQSLGMRFDLILISAVWMHLPIAQRPIAIKALSTLLSADGALVITLRHGEFQDGRETFGVSVAELEQLSHESGLIKYYLSNYLADFSSPDN
ncbi:class I SAM-dependent methyltransferase [Vibrio neptunius]|uniref:class I SAM-dependent methyltransferase n=1 Tax=Vibrio neptunius TaxID=170651 RepID=UPI00331479C2